MCLAHGLLARTAAMSSPSSGDAPVPDGDSDAGAPTLSSHFIIKSGSHTGRRARCRYCRVVIQGQARGDAKYGHHLGHCDSLPPEVKRELDERAVASFKAGDVLYADLYESFEVTGWMRARCLRCDRTQRGDTATIARHAPLCRGSAATVASVSVEHHFTHSQTAGIRRVYSVCVHCGKMVERRTLADTLPLRRHVGRCQSLPQGARAKLDAAAVRDAGAHAGQYARGSVYDGFRVTGFMRAVCGNCGGAVRGGSSDLRTHTKRCAAGKTRVEGQRAIDVAQGHFTVAEGLPQHRTCVHCSSTVKHKPASNLRQHMSRCKSLPSAARAALDAPALAAYAARKGVYADPEMHRHFRAVGFNRDECTACGTQVTGGRSKMRRHLGKCDAAKLAAQAAAVDDSDGSSSSALNAGAGCGAGGGSAKRRRDSGVEESDGAQVPAGGGGSASRGGTEAPAGGAAAMDRSAAKRARTAGGVVEGATGTQP